MEIVQEDDAHPAAFTEEHVTKGFSRIRLSAADLGPERTTILVVEILGRLRYLKSDQKKKKKKKNVRTAEDQSMNDAERKQEAGDFVSSMVAELSADPNLTDQDLLNPMTWEERLNFISDKWELLAIYVIRWRTDELKYFVNPVIEDSEVNANAETIRLVVQRAQQLREERFPRQVLAASAGAQATTSEKMFLSYDLLERALAPRKYTSADMLSFKTSSTEDMGYDMLNMIDNLVSMFLNYAPALAVLFLIQSPLFVESQVDHLWSKLQTQSTDRIHEATLQLAMAIQSVPNNPETQEELIRIYERMRGANTIPPRNWGLSLVLITAIKTMDALWGHVGKRPVMFVASKGTASYMKTTKPSYYDPEAMSDKQRYALRKTAAVQVYDALLNLKVKQNPEVYIPLQKFMYTALTKNDGRGNTVAKLDDVFDPLAMIITGAEKHLRERAYNVNEAPKVNQAMEIWKKCGDRLRANKTHKQHGAINSSGAQAKWVPPPSILDILAQCDALDEDLFDAEEIAPAKAPTLPKPATVPLRPTPPPEKSGLISGSSAKQPSAPVQFKTPAPVRQGQLLFEKKTGVVSLNTKTKNATKTGTGTSSTSGSRKPSVKNAAPAQIAVIDLVDGSETTDQFDDFMTGLLETPLFASPKARAATAPAEPKVREPAAPRQRVAKRKYPVIKEDDDDDIILDDIIDNEMSFGLDGVASISDSGPAPKRSKVWTSSGGDHYRERPATATKHRPGASNGPRLNAVLRLDDKTGFGTDRDEFETDRFANPYGGI